MVGLDYPSQSISRSFVPDAGWLRSWRGERLILPHAPGSKWLGMFGYGEDFGRVLWDNNRLLFGGPSNNQPNLHP